VPKKCDVARYARHAKARHLRQRLQGLVRGIDAKHAADLWLLRCIGQHDRSARAIARHFVDCFRDGTEPRETFVDGYIVNCALDACYRSMKSGTWEPIEIDESLV